MNFITAILIFACLIGSDLVCGPASKQLGTRLMAVILTASLVPAIAWLQTTLMLQKWRSEQFSVASRISLCRRMSVSHLIVWLSASVAIIWALQWQDIVRENWNLDRWPVLDEWTILAPIILPMILSWAAFYPLYQEMQLDLRPAFRGMATSSEAKPTTLWEFLSIRFRVYFLVILIPLSGFLAIRDATEMNAHLPQSLNLGLTISLLSGLTLLMPFLMLLIWKNGPIEDPQLRRVLQETADCHRLRVATIRTWKTGRQIVNAAVAGWLPGFRIIFLSDGLLRQFPCDEIAAVLRHEAGHIRMWHVPIRLFLVTTPWLVFAFSWVAIEGGSAELIWNSGHLPGTRTLHPHWPWILVGALVALFQLSLIRSISHRMELAADRYAILADSTRLTGWWDRPVCEHRATSLTRALFRLASLAPETFDRRSFFHPSIRQRVKSIEQASRNEEAKKLGLGTR